MLILVLSIVLLALSGTLALLRAPLVVYATTARFTVDEPFADRILRPLGARWAARAMWLRWLQQGRLSLYLLDVFVMLLVSVAWALVFPHLRALR